MRLLFLLFLLLGCLIQTASGKKDRFHECEHMGGVCRYQKTHGCSILPAQCKSRYKHCCRL
uniref:Uncharacterized protein n=1 Tax=Piliocolobus tephrosceles TaxID=591936 RepID=A0A8C9IMK5_9PRIM